MGDASPGDGDDQPSPRHIARTIALAVGVDSAGVLPVYLVGAMAVQLDTEIGLAPDRLGLVFAAYFTGAALFSAVVGRAIDRIGPAVFLRLGTALTALTLTGLASARSFAALIASVGTAGVATALTRPASSVLLARVVPRQRQGLALGVRNCAIPVAALVSGLAVPAIALPIGWRWAFATGAVLSAALLPVLPRRLPAPPGRPSRQSGTTVGHQLSLALAAALASAAAVSLGAFTAVTAVAAGITEAGAGALIATGSLIGVGGRIGLGLWTDRRDGSQLDIVAGLMGIGAMSYAAVALGLPGVLWAAVPLAYATGWAFYGPYYLAVLRLNRQAPGSALGIAQTGSFAGSIIGPLALGAIAASRGLATSWVLAAAAAATAALITHGIRLRLRHQVLEEHGPAESSERATDAVNE